ncbi:anti-sigma factor [Rhizobium sp. FY34]|uniref:anti-sigma factor n=1 Tax=Rhizobium sp. FY34 TaxID=2562309 RepID=UPI0010C0421D|nr:anti-sigma factor [Rhizobium sp. FY34]
MTRPDQSEGDRPRDEVLAGEYVLGVLSSEARARVEARLRTDKAFAAIVARWQENLGTLDDEYTTIVSSDFALPRRDTRPLALPARSGNVRLISSLWASVAFWRGLALGSIFLLVGTILNAERTTVSRAGAPVLASMKGDGNSALGLIARYDAKSGILQLAPFANSASGQQSLEVWLMRGSDPAISLGVLPQTAEGAGALVVPQAQRARLQDGNATLAVSLEPLGGSPAGQPTGALLVSGETRIP